jgi:chemotaxis signal transduction protein
MSAVHIRVIAGTEHYAISVDHVLEIAEFGEVAPVPGAPPEVTGVRNLRGQVIPVIDLATVLGLSDDADRQRIVITEESGRRGGLAVTEIVDVSELPEAAEKAESHYLAGAVLVDGDLVGVLDVSAVLDALSVAVPA